MNSSSFRRRALLVASAGLLLLAVEAFVSHVSWNTGRILPLQIIPIAYGSLATLALVITALWFPQRDGVVRIVGILGLLVGTAGTFFHGRAVLADLTGVALTVRHVGNTLKLDPPIFAPAGFAGVGLFLLALPRLRVV